MISTSKSYYWLEKLWKIARRTQRDFIFFFIDLFIHIRSFHHFYDVDFRTENFPLYFTLNLYEIFAKMMRADEIKRCVAHNSP